MSKDNDLRILIRASLDTSEKSITQINKNIRELQAKVDTLKLNIQVNDTVLKTLNNFSHQMSRLSNEALQASKNVQEVFMPDGTRVKTSSFENLHKSMDEIIVSGQKAKKTAEGIVGTTKEATNANKQLNDVTKERERILQYEQRVRKAIADKEQREREKALQFEQKARQSIEQTQQKEKQKTAELQKQIELYKKQAQLNAKNINRTHGRTVDNKELNNYLNSVNNLSVATPNLRHKMKDLTMEFKQLSANAKEASLSVGRDNMSAVEGLRTALVKFPIWMLSATIFYQPLRIGRELVTTLIEIDKQMTTLARVTNGEADITRTLRESAEMADRLGNRLESVNDAIIGFARQGFRDDELLAMAEVATLMGNVSDLSLEDSMSRLTSAVKSFNIEATDSIRIVDALNEVDNNFAITTADLTATLQKAGGAANTFGVDMEQVLGHATAIGQVTRESGNILGNSLKTIYSRITTMSGSIELLEKAGISVYDSMGQLRDVGSILDELGQGWSGLNSETQQMIGLQLAGLTFSPIFKRLNMQSVKFRENLETGNPEPNLIIREVQRL